MSASPRSITNRAIDRSGAASSGIAASLRVASRRHRRGDDTGVSDACHHHAQMTEEGTLERRVVTVLFADLVGFTPLSERLDAEDVAAIQDAYFAAVRETVIRYGGRLEKFIGDAAVAAFGVPRGRDDDPERATRAGAAIIHAVEDLGARLGLASGELQVRVGIQTGEVV